MSPTSAVRPVAGAWDDPWARGPGVKVCGLTRREDVLLAAELGAWALGFVFAPGPRRVTPDRAAHLVEALRATYPAGSGPRAVGVFQDAPPEVVAGIVCDVGLDMVQLHGEESPYQVHRICEAAGRALVIKVISVEHGTAAPASIVARVQAVASEVDAIVLDSRVRDRVGGTGVRYRWELARPAAGYVPVLVSGGIGPENLREALAVSAAWGVDVCGGIESSPGVKDPDLMRALFARVERC